MFVLEFFGATLHVAGTVDFADLSFFFGPHLRDSSPEPARLSQPTPLSVHFARLGDSGREVRVHDGEGTLLRRRTFLGIGGIPPVLPPFAVLGGQYALVQAAVLSKPAPHGGSDSVVALIGGVGSPRNSVALALGGRGWRMVSGQYLVIDRADGRTLPYQLPVELCGSALESARLGGLGDAPENSLRTVSSPLAGCSVQIRPERLLDTVGVGECLPPARLIRLCSTGARQCGLEDWEFTPSVWPPEAATDLPPTRRLRLLLPEQDGAEEAADLVDEQLSAPEAPEVEPLPGDNGRFPKPSSAPRETAGAG